MERSSLIAVLVLTGGLGRAFALPTGPVTVLLTDGEGSTKRWEADPDAMAAGVVIHYDTMRGERVRSINGVGEPDGTNDHTNDHMNDNGR